MSTKILAVSSEQVEAIAEILEKKGLLDNYNLARMTHDTFYAHMFSALNAVINDGVDKSDMTVINIDVAVPTQIAKQYNEVRERFGNSMMTMESDGGPLKDKSFLTDVLRSCEGAFLLAGVRAMGQEAMERMDMMMDEITKSMGNDKENDE